MAGRTLTGGITWIGVISGIYIIPLPIKVLNDFDMK